MKLFSTCLLAGTTLLASMTQALYKFPGPVIELTTANFKKEVLDDDAMWLVEFYAPWCGHCKQLAPSWELAAKQLKGVVKLGAVDMTEHQSVGQPYDVKGFPTIKFFGSDKKKPVDYQSGRDADSIRKFALDKVVSEVNGRTKKGKKDSSSGSGSGSGSGSSGGAATDKNVVVLTDSTFDAAVMGSKDIWIVEFYAPWCGHCKALEPEYNEAATKLKSTKGIKLAKVDATEN